MDRLDCEYHLEPGRGSLWTIHGEWTGEVDLGPAVLGALRMLEIADQTAYGERLFDALFPPGSKLREGYRMAEALAPRSGLRFCLYLSAALPEAERTLEWELIRDPEKNQALARSPRITFVLCPHLSGLAPAPAPLIFRPRVLVAVADGPDLGHYHLAPLGELRTALEKSFRSLRWRISCELMRGPVTRAALQQKLREGRFDVLHLVAHGLPPQYGDPSVLLQQENGLTERVAPEALADDLSDCGVRLAVLTVCHGAASLAGLLLRRGIPAVIAMRREISVKAADVFVNAFYPALARSGEVDTAVNRARSRLEQTPAVRRHWSDPILLWTRAPWRKAHVSWIPPSVGAAMLCLGFALGWRPCPTCPTPEPCPDNRPCPVCLDCPTPPAPVLQVTRVAGQPIAAGQELTVPPSGDLEGIYILPPQPYSVHAETVADGYSDKQRADSSAAGWLFRNVSFRRPQNPGETRATVTITAGDPPVSQQVRVRVPAPRVTIAEAAKNGQSLVIKGTAENVLAQEEQVWVEIRKLGDGGNPKCLYSSVENGAWAVEDHWAGGGSGSYQIRAGLIVRPPEGRSCPGGLAPLDRRIVSA